jgi:hypothetical protein
MPVAAIGAWEFWVPDGWEIEDRGDGVSYLEAPDGTRGMYVKCIELTEPESCARDLAQYIQETHEASFSQLAGSDWVVVDRRNTPEMSLHKSALDMLDSRATYRVLSIVVCNAREAIQVTLHDYLCEDYAEAKDTFAAVEGSIGRVAGAA